MFELEPLNRTMPTPDPQLLERLKVAPEDVASPDRVIDAYWRLASNPPGQRDWEAMAALFHPCAGFRTTIFRTEEQGLQTSFMNGFEAYREWCEELLNQNALYERDLVRRVSQFGHMALVQNSVIACNEPDGEPFGWTMKFWTLFWDESRWWIITIMTEVFGPEAEIPPEWRARDE